MKIVEADDDYPGPATISASTSQARSAPTKPATKHYYSDEDEDENEGGSDDWEREDLLPENEVWATSGGRPNAVRRTKQVARRSLPARRPQAISATADKEVIEVSDDSENETVFLSDEPEVDVKSKTQQKRKASEINLEYEDEAEEEEEEEYIPVQRRKKIPHHELARMAAARRRGEPVKRQKI